MGIVLPWLLVAILAIVAIAVARHLRQRRALETPPGELPARTPDDAPAPEPISRERAEHEEARPRILHPSDGG